ncbi:MAG: response regulator transcription factor [Inquilinus sp.]|nr:response regulator transcription factor [Inquilinus sp.]
MGERPAVFIVDDDSAVRESLSFLFASVDLDVEAFESADAFLASVGPDRAGCVVTDVRMPGLSGLDLQRLMAQRGVSLPIIVITGHGDVRMAVRAMKEGAIDFVEKPFNGQEVLDLVQRTLSGQDSRGNNGTFANVDDWRRLQTLTPRERQVLDQVVAGEPNKRIAFTLGISEKTVEFHRANIMAKMEARSAADLIRRVAVLTVGKGIS